MVDYSTGAAAAAAVKDRSPRVVRVSGTSQVATLDDRSPSTATCTRPEQDGQPRLYIHNTKFTHTAQPFSITLSSTLLWITYR